MKKMHSHTVVSDAKKREIYTRLLNVSNPDDPNQFDKKAFAKEMGISGRALNGYITTLKTNATKRNELNELGFEDDQIPQWVAPAERLSGIRQRVQVPAAAVPAGTPVHAVVAGKKSDADERSDADVADGSSAKADAITERPTLSARSALDAINKALGPGGERIESLSSDSLQRWMMDNGIEERDGEYWQRRKLSSGEVALVEVKPPKDVLEAEEMGDSELSEMMYRSLEGETQALMKKVAFNPTAFTYYQWSKRRKLLAPHKDFGDFVNMCIVLTMQKIFGARVGVILNAENTIYGMYLAQKSNTEIDYT